MKIVVAQISEDEGLNVHHLYQEGDLGLAGGEGHLRGQCELTLRATRTDAKVALVGRVNAVVEFECDRCLTSLSIPVQAPFDLLYVPPIGTADESELAENDLSLSFYQDGIINVDDLTREQIVLALPMARLCSDDCRGLCPRCGANLNSGQCTCREEVDARWAPLKELKSKLN